MSEYLVKHYMSEDVPTAESHASVVEAAKEMSKLDKGFLIVLKGGQPAGIVTERDFLKKILVAELDPAKVSIGEIMSSPLITVDPDMDLVEATKVMQAKNIRLVVVAKDGIIYGVLTSAEIARHFVDYLDRESRDIMRWCSLIG